MIIAGTGNLCSISGTSSAPAYSFINTTNTGIFSSGTNILNFSTNGSERMRVQSDGTFLIGSTSNYDSGTKVYIYNTTGYAGLRVRQYNASGAYNMVSIVNNNSCKALVVQNSGDKFEVWGDGHTEIGGIYSQTYMLNVYGTTYCSGGVWSASDSQFKQDITSIEKPMDKLNHINGKKYKFNISKFPGKNFPQGDAYGVLAQEVQSVFPELVQADSAGYLAVNYEGLIPVIIEAVKEQQKTIKEQQEQINALQGELSDCCNTGKTKDMKINNSNSGSESSKTAYLMQNVPNPFSIKTTIRYYIPENTNSAELMIFDMQGKLIKTYAVNNKKEGYTEINGGEMQPGMYMYSLIIDGKELDTKRMILTN